MDFDGDGRLDLLSGSNCCDSAGFHLFRRKKDGSWTPRQRLEVPYPDEPAARFCRQESFVTAVDWNNDGMPDLLWVGPYGRGISVDLGPLKESEPISLSNEIDFIPKGYVSDFAVADWDQDGKPGLLIRQRLPDWTGKEGIYWYRNVGKAGRPKLAEGKLVLEGEALVGENSIDASVEGFCVCDWNGDGRPDLIVTRKESMRKDETGQRVDWRGTVWLYLRE